MAGIPEEPPCSASFPTAAGAKSRPRAAPGNWMDNILIFESPLEINAWLHGKGNGNNNVKRPGTPRHYHFIQMYLRFKEDSNES